MKHFQVYINFQLFETKVLVIANVQTFSITSNNFHFVSPCAVLTVFELNLIEHKRPHIVTEPVCVQSTLQNA